MIVVCWKLWSAHLFGMLRTQPWKVSLRNKHIPNQKGCKTATTPCHCQQQINWRDLLILHLLNVPPHLWLLSLRLLRCQDANPPIQKVFHQQIHGNHGKNNMGENIWENHMLYEQHVSNTHHPTYKFYKNQSTKSSNITNKNKQFNISHKPKSPKFKT